MCGLVVKLEIDMDWLPERLRKPGLECATWFRPTLLSLNSEWQAARILLHRRFPTLSTHSKLLWEDPAFEFRRESILMGFKTGSAVGLAVGSVVGAYSAVHHRRPAIFPKTALGTTAAFGVFLAAGMATR